MVCSAARKTVRRLRWATPRLPIGITRSNGSMTRSRRRFAGVKRDNRATVERFDARDAPLLVAHRDHGTGLKA